MKSFQFITLFFLITVSHSVIGSEYDPLLLRAQATVFPKIIMLDEEIDKKIEKNVVSFQLFFSDKDKQTAERLKELIQENYGQSFGDKEFNVTISSFNDFSQQNIATAYFLLKGTPENHQRITQHAANNRRLVFCYDYNDFSHKPLISLQVKEKTYIYLNKTAIHDYGIKFKPLFYNIVKVIE